MAVIESEKKMSVLQSRAGLSRMDDMTPKREKFCSAYIETGNASEAYRQSFNASKMKPESIHSKAYELLNNGEIRLRIAELKDSHAKRHEVTVDDIRKMLLEDRDFAKECETPAAAVSASMGLAKLYGHLRDKIEHTGDLSVSFKTVFESKPDDPDSDG